MAPIEGVAGAAVGKTNWPLNAPPPTPDQSIIALLVPTQLVVSVPPLKLTLDPLRLVEPLTVNDPLSVVVPKMDKDPVMLFAPITVLDPVMKTLPLIVLVPISVLDPEINKDPVTCTTEAEAKIRFDLAASDVPFPRINADCAEDAMLNWPCAC